MSNMYAVTPNRKSHADLYNVKHTLHGHSNNHATRTMPLYPCHNGSHDPDHQPNQPSPVMGQLGTAHGKINEKYRVVVDRSELTIHDYTTKAPISEGFITSHVNMAGLVGSVFIRPFIAQP
jgi:hypothetical protein